MSSHLAGLADFVRVVVGAEGVVAATIDVHAVGDFEVVVPKPVFFGDGGVNAGAGGVD